MRAERGAPAQNVEKDETQGYRAQTNVLSVFV
jgi:hypothetical protein